MKVEIDIHKLTIHYPLELYEIMQAVLRREQRFDKNKEHFWVIALDHGRTILNLEHISTGTAQSTLVEPAKVLSAPLKKEASGLMLVHNHPSGRLEASEADKDLTDRLIQACRLMKVPVLDHVIITDKSYYSFKAGGLLEHLEASNKYRLSYELEKEYHQELEQRIKELQDVHEQKLRMREEEIARKMLTMGLDAELISRATGLSPEHMEALRKGIQP